MASKKRKTIWVQQVAVEVDVLQTRVDIAKQRDLRPEQKAAIRGVELFLTKAWLAVERADPVPSRIVNWWRGVLVEAAYRNIHAARAQLVDAYTEEDIDAEIPGAIARAHRSLHRDDPRCLSQTQLRALPLAHRRARLRRLVEDGYEAIDLQHGRLRSFRNIILMAAFVVIVLVGITIGVVWSNPSVMPLCFPNQVVQGALTTTQHNYNCPTGDNTTAAQAGDVGIVALLGLLGGALAASVAIRNIRGTSTPYDVPVALAWLKIPLGAFTAILGIVAIHGGFVPGLSVLDSQQQILAYALLLGFAQQLFTGALDRRAQTLLEGVSHKEAQFANADPSAATDPSSAAVLQPRETTG
jgi:hypothetical protein